MTSNVIPSCLWIKVLNNYLTFSETRGALNPYVTLGREWCQLYKAANRILKQVTITRNNFRQSLEMLVKLQLPRIQEVAFKNLSETEINTLCECPPSLPSTIQVILLSYDRHVVYLDMRSLTEFILKNAHVPLFTFCSNLDDFATEVSAKTLNTNLYMTPSIPRIHVGQFVKLETHCPNVKSADVGQLRWVNQCPYDNCGEHFCWGYSSCETCAKESPTVVLCCTERSRPAQIVCPRHLKQYCKQDPGGRWVCDDCRSAAELV